MQGTSWADGLELVGDDDRLVGFAGVLPLRLLAERTGLRAGLSAAMARRGFDPVYDRGQVLVDLAVAQVLGGEVISDFQGLRHLAPVIGPVPSTPTVWRTLSEAGELQLTRRNAAVTAFRRHWWGLLAARPQGFPWLRVAGRELTGVTVVDLDASIVFAASEKENAQPTYKGGIGFCPNLATCDNTDDMLAIDPRPGGATSNCAKDNIALLDLAVSRLPSRYQRRVLVRLDGAGFSHDLLEHIAAGGGVKGRQWEFSVGWSCTDKEMDAIQALPADAWTPGIDQNGDLIGDTRVADLTGLLDLGRWHDKIPWRQRGPDPGQGNLAAGGDRAHLRHRPNHRDYTDRHQVNQAGPHSHVCVPRREAPRPHPETDYLRSGTGRGRETTTPPRGRGVARCVRWPSCGTAPRRPRGCCCCSGVPGRSGRRRSYGRRKVRSWVSGMSRSCTACSTVRTGCACFGKPAPSDPVPIDQASLAGQHCRLCIPLGGTWYSGTRVRRGRITDPDAAALVNHEEATLLTSYGSHPSAHTDQHEPDIHSAPGFASVPWSVAATATLHCLTGCAIGEVLGMVIGTVGGLHNAATVVLSIVLAFIFGYALTMRGVLLAGVGLRQAFSVALAADTVSIAVMELLDNAVMVAVPGAMDAGLTSALFWGSLAFSFVVAFLLIAPVNRWMIGRGKGHAVVHAYHH